ncbi:hypothetical protein [Alishewanella sp. HH-ZS]|uniref:hypothetical protein n=1 Tax=Alishewanella sp. HH-ZS TaxID=1856684 RepID=UPI0008236DBD|nr:hypothetical protein [Alishewanella sp. HH-ZS]OCW95715.1 hypothetical protein A9165_13760 [Alishewanella sp. HH-ZS]
MKTVTKLMMATVLGLTLAAPASANSLNNLSEMTSDLLNRQLVEVRESIKVQTKQALENSVRLVAEQMKLSQNTEQQAEQTVSAETANTAAQPKAE